MNGLKHSVLGAAIALSLIGCGTSGGYHGDPPPPSRDPPPPQTADTEPCPSPVTTDCVITTDGTMLDGRDSAHALIVEQGTLALGIDGSGWTYTFDGDTRVDPDGGLRVPNNNILASNVANSGYLQVIGTIIGNVTNAGTVRLYGVVQGNLANAGRVTVSGASYWDDSSNTITGDFSQTSDGTLSFALAPGFTAASTPFRVDGKASLAGDLEFVEYTDGWGPYPLPNLGTHHILHANGGVFGMFDAWDSPSLFIEGSLRYDANDVWFDLTRISLQAAAASQGLGSQLTVDSAGNLDRVLSVAEAFGSHPGSSRRQFLDAAARLLWMRDPAQAARALDSLSGVEHAAGLQAAAEGTAQQMAVGVHLDAMQPGRAAGAWAREDGAGTVAGFDQWLGPRLLAGVRTGERTASGGPEAAGTDLSAGAYLRWFGNAGWYAGADAGFTRRTLGLARTIDFGNAGRWQARSRRVLGAMAVSGEVGRRMVVGGGTLTPFVGADLGIVHGAESIEQGASGFELALADATQRDLHARAGLRFARDWRLGDGAWLGVQASTGLERLVTAGGDAQQASFTAVPDTWFALPDDNRRSAHWTSLGLQGGWDRGWRWSAYRASGALAVDRQWSLLLRRDW